MSKRSLDYDLSIPKRLKKSRKEPKEEPEGEEINPEEIVCDFMGMTDTVTKGRIIFISIGVNKKNIVKLITAINDVTKRLKIMEIEYGVENLKINLHINSFGGSVFAALSAIDTIMVMMYLLFLLEGGAASAATLISVVCHERRITPNSFMLVHQLSSGFWGKMEEIKDEFINLKKLMKTLTKLYKKHTTIDESDETTLKDLLKRDLWLSANECLKYGMVDSVE